MYGVEKVDASVMLSTRLPTTTLHLTHLVISSVVIISLMANTIAMPVSPPPLPIASLIQVTNRPTRSVSPYNLQRWPNAIIPFEIDDSLLRPDYQDAIRTAINEYQQKTCIHFQKRTNETAFIRFTRDKGCYSNNIGRSGRMQSISLGPGCLNTGTIIHEIGHAVGFAHEHSRSDRDGFVTIFWSNIINEADIRRQFDESRRDQLNTQYDHHSIMQYGEQAFLNKSNPGNTMQAKQSNIKLLDPSHKAGLSELDVIAVNILYSCQDNKKRR